MRSHVPLRAAFVVALTLAGGVSSKAQTHWPAAKTATPVVSKPVQAPTKTVRRKSVRPRPAPAPSRQETELLRAMVDVVARQAATLEMLARRLEAAEARLAAMEIIEDGVGTTPASPPLAP
jgi:hypothetical protein